MPFVPASIAPLNAATLFSGYFPLYPLCATVWGIEMPDLFVVVRGEVVGAGVWSGDDVAAGVFMLVEMVGSCLVVGY